MPLSFTEIAATGDPLPANRHLLKFPTLPGGASGHALTLRHTTVTLPAIAVGQVLVRVLGYPLAFGGTTMMDNHFTAEFVETTNAPVVKTLINWKDKVSGHKTHRGLLKQDYAVNAQCIAHDTAGEKALVCDLFNVFPYSITFGNYVEESTPCHVSVEFSVDAIDINGLIYMEEGFEYSSVVTSEFDSPSSTKQGSFTVQQQILSQLGIPNGGIQNLISLFF